jgi:uncharacterized protein YbjT (DUF2867 family)
MTYLVTAATGNIGAATLAALLARGQSVRAASRRAQDWPDGVEGVQADLNDPEAFTEAARDVGGAFVMAGYPSEAGLLAALPEDAHVVLLSSSAAPTGRLENAAARYHIVSERAVEASGRAWTMLQPNAFMSNALRWKPQLAAGDVVRAPFAEVAIACVDPADIGAVAATALVEGERHAARRYRLSGPEALEPAAQVAQLARALGRPLRFEAIDDVRAREEMGEQMSAAYVDAFFEFYRDGLIDETTVHPTVAAVLGRPPGTFEAWVRANAAAFA